jgi:enamine deaminase RidA (YjgF/YER057c/UK114 family)
MGLIRDRAALAGIALPMAPAPAGLYIPLWYGAGRWRTSGILPMHNGSPVVARAHAGVTDTVGQAVRLALLNAMAIVDAYLPEAQAQTLTLTHLCGYINAVPEYTEGHLAMNVASQTIRDILGDAGVHTREAIHVAGLPLGALVELRIEGNY